MRHAVRPVALLSSMLFAASLTGCASDDVGRSGKSSSSAVAFLDEHTLTVGGGATSFGLLDQQPSELSFRIDVGTLTASDYRTPMGNFTRLSIPGFHASTRIGSPELPKMNRLIAIPYGTKARIEVVASETATYSLADLGVAYPLMPVQPSQTKCGDAENPDFTCDTSIYSTRRVAEPVAQVIEQGRLRNLDLGRLEVAPVQYFPTTGEILVYTSIEFKVVFEDVATRGLDPYNAYADSPFFSYAGIVGAEPTLRGKPNLVQDVVTYVIVTPPEYVATLKRFVDWKTQKGFRVVTGVTGSSEVGSTKESIRDYVQKLYKNATAAQPAPSFVLFVGDIQQVPTWQSENEYTDRVYCAVDNDQIPDMYYGRLPAATNDQLVAMLDKTLMHDQLTAPDLSYLGKSLLIAGVDSTHAPTWGNGQINYGTQYYFNAAHGNQPFVLLYPASSESSAECKVLQQLSAGVGFANYTAHGSNTSWADPAMSQDNVRALTNENKYPIVVGNCCLTSSYQDDESFSETWLRVAKKGAVGYIGGSNSTLWDEDYWWGVGSGAVAANPTYESNGQGAYDGVFHDHGQPYTNWFVTADSLIYAGNLAVTEAGSPKTNYYWNIYNLAGDPSLLVHTRVPTDNAVGYQPSIFTNATKLNVAAAAGTYVGLTQNGELVGAGTIKAEGRADIALWKTLVAGKLHLVATAQNFKTYQGDLKVSAPAVFTLSPATIAANKPTQVTVTLVDAETMAPLAGVEMWAAGLGYVGDSAFTDAKGQATILVDYAYGPSVTIECKKASDTTPSFDTSLPVTAIDLPTPDLKVQTDFGLADKFAANLPGTLVATTGAVSGAVTLFATLDGEAQVYSAAGTALAVTPSIAKNVSGFIAVPGYNVYEERFPVILAYGTLAGTVTSNGKVLPGAVVRLYQDQPTPVAEATTDAAGRCAFKTEMPVATYRLTADLFGYTHFESSAFLGYGAGSFDIAVDVAPAAALTGKITDAKSGAGLVAAVRVYRADNQQKVAETTTSASGAYAFAALTQFDYVVEARATRHIATKVAVSLNNGSAVQNFALQPTVGGILLVQDAPDGGAALKATMTQLGYSVVVESTATTDTTKWGNYDLLVVSSGDNSSGLSQDNVRQALRAFVAQGQNLLIEGGEIGYKWRTADTAFAQQVLHMQDWITDDSGSMVPKEPLHALLKSPNQLAGTIALTYSSYGDQDSVVPTSDAVAVATWSKQPTAAALVAYEGTGRTVYMPFDSTHLTGQPRTSLLQNIFTWLMPAITERNVGRGSLVINEVLADPPSGVDVNGDGEASVVTDEFVEIVNASADDVDMSGMLLADQAMYDLANYRYQFPEGSVLPAGAALVVWGAMAPLGLANAGDAVYLIADGNIIDSVTYGPEGGQDVSLTRAIDGDINSPLVLHDSLPAKLPYSPGVRSSGESF
jgi:hypothetical protein